MALHHFPTVMSIFHHLLKNINKLRLGLEIQSCSSRRRQSTRDKRTASIYSLHSGLYCKMINANILFGKKKRNIIKKYFFFLVCSWCLFPSRFFCPKNIFFILLNMTSGKIKKKRHDTHSFWSWTLFCCKQVWDIYWLGMVAESSYQFLSRNSTTSK